MGKNMLKEKSAVLLAAAFCAAFASASPMKFLSFNVWGDYFKNPVNEREAAIESTIRKYSPDVVALQEMTPAWWESPMLGNLSSEYGVVRGDEEDVFTYWWYDADKAAELADAMKRRDFLPSVPLRVNFDEAAAAR